jgi:hypothetical protein
VNTLAERTARATSMRDDIWQEACRCTGTMPDDDDAVAAALLLASAIIGPFLTQICKAIGVAPERVTWMAANLRRNGIWTRRKVVTGDWWDPETGGCEFILNVGVALGVLDCAEGPR